MKSGFSIRCVMNSVYMTNPARNQSVTGVPIASHALATSRLDSL
jgi:hypothetical protein